MTAAPSARLRASQQLRETAMASVANDPAATSAVLLSELATLLAATMRRVELKDRDFPEFNDFIGPAHLRTWWSSYHAVLTPEHMEEARAALVACGCGDAEVAT